MNLHQPPIIHDMTNPHQQRLSFGINSNLFRQQTHKSYKKTETKTSKQFEGIRRNDTTEQQKLKDGIIYFTGNNYQEEESELEGSQISE